MEDRPEESSEELYAEHDVEVTVPLKEPEKIEEKPKINRLSYLRRDG